MGRPDVWKQQQQNGKIPDKGIRATSRARQILGIDARGNKYFSIFYDTSNSSESPKNYTWFAVLKPSELRTNGKTWLALWYYINSGSTIEEYNDR